MKYKVRVYLQCLTAADIYSSDLSNDEVPGVCPDVVCARIIFSETSTTIQPG